MGKRSLVPDLWIIAALFSANLLVLGPYLLTDYPNQPWNNGYMYIGFAQAFRDYHWTWNPATYGGAPLRYLYPPIFPVLMDALPVASLGRAYHLVSGFGYALTPVALYFLCLQLFRSRLLAGFAAVAYSSFPSAAYAFLPQWKSLAEPFAGAPWGYVALVGYEEAPHGFALVFSLAAITAAFRNSWICASFLAAAVMLISWPGLLGLGMAMIAVAAAKTRDSGFLKPGLSALGTVGTGYGLAAFWMTPGFLLSTALLNRVVLRHTLLAAPWNRTTWLILSVAAAVFGLSLWRRVPAVGALLLAWLAIAGAVILTYTLVGNYIVPLPHRYMLEFNVSLVLAITGVISLASRFRPLLVAAVFVAGAPAAFHFVRHAWSVQARPENPQNSVGYPIAAWLNRDTGYTGASRILASGELEPALSVWTRLPQVGGSGQGVSNPLIFAAQRQIIFGCGADSEKIAELWLRALNAGYLAVHEPVSREYFHWFSNPEKFSVLPVAWDNGEGDTVFRLPDFDRQEAVVVDLQALSRLPRLRSTGDTRFLEAYVGWAAGKRPVSIHWNRADSADLEADLGADEAILVKTNNDPGWRISNASTMSDPIGFLLIRGPQGRQHLNLRFGASRDTWLGAAITAFTIILLIAGVPGIWIAAVSLIPSVAAYLFLASGMPSTVGAAEEAFIRLQPPIVNPRGIVDAITYAQPPFGRGRVIAIYGLNLGGPRDSVRVLAGDRPVEVLYRGLNQIQFKLPPDASAKVPVSVEVNGCRGNSFAVESHQ